MLEGAQAVLHGPVSPELCRPLGSRQHELPLGTQWLAEREDIDKVICIGSVIRGETAHFDYVCSAAAQGILRVNQDTGKPVMFCVLTDDTHEQAAARSGGEHGNKGVEAAVGLLNMLALKQTLSPSQS